MKSIQFYITPAAGKRLIGKGLAARPDITEALANRTILIIPGTTNAYVAQEILRKIGAGEAEKIAFRSFHRGITLPHGYKMRSDTFSGDLVIEQGKVSFSDDLHASCAMLKTGDIVLKGANAVQLEDRQAAVLIGNTVNGGTVMEAANAVLSRRAKLIFPVGVEKRVSGSLKAFEAVCNDPEAVGLRMFAAPGEPFTELDAIAVLTGATAMVIAGGGICGAEGGCYIVAQGTDEQIAELRIVITEVVNEPMLTLD